MQKDQYNDLMVFFKDQYLNTLPTYPVMNREDIVNYFREYENFKPKIIHRELKVPVDSDFIITILGPRRAGKTYYLLQISQQLGNTVYLNFEDMRLRGLKYTEIVHDLFSFHNRVCE